MIVYDSPKDILSEFQKRKHFMAKRKLSSRVFYSRADLAAGSAVKSKSLVRLPRVSRDLHSPGHWRRHARSRYRKEGGEKRRERGTAKRRREEKEGRAQQSLESKRVRHGDEASKQRVP